ncbi:MAG: hypothetical protein ACXV5I_07630 [Halobacteriota archaeon]
MTRKFTAVTAVLIILLALLIISQIAATLSWWLFPSTQSVISQAGTAGVSVTVAIGTVVAVLYLIALVGIVQRKTWGALLACATALFDIAIGFFLSATVLYALAGAALLAVVAVLAYLEYRHLRIAGIQTYGA